MIRLVKAKRLKFTSREHIEVVSSSSVVESDNISCQLMTGLCCFLELDLAPKPTKKGSDHHEGMLNTTNQGH